MLLKLEKGVPRKKGLKLGKIFRSQKPLAYQCKGTVAQDVF
jgi:hypothetical protein